MPANDAFTAGVRPGGLTSSTEIRLLLCYLVKNAGPIARQEIENALMEEALVNYFEIGSCLDDITRQQLVTVQDNVYSITDKGRKVAQELAYDLPRTVRESAIRAAFSVTHRIPYIRRIRRTSVREAMCRAAIPTDRQIVETATSGGHREITAVQTQPEGSIPTAVRTGDNDFNQCKRPLI